MSRLLMIGLALVLTQLLSAQSQEIETENGATLVITEKDGTPQQLPRSLELRATLNNGDTYFSIDGVNGLQMFPRDPQVPQAFSFKLTNGGMQYFDALGDEQMAIKLIAGKYRVSTDEVEILGGSDLSEYFDVKSESVVKPGMLVSIAGEGGSLAITNEKRDKKVVGIVSGANGIETGLMMGQRGSIADGDTPIALTGRTYVYATTENGTIEAGDFLTSSSTPGYAMKVKKHRKSKGAIVGKAMTSLKEGNGFVLVLVNLQ